MNTFRIVVLLLAAASSAAKAGEVRVGGRSFTVPDGLTVELVAGAPMAERPIVADFDERGRLYVAESSGSNDPVGKQLAERPHRVVRLEDSDGDGRFDQRVVFADRMMLPEGAMWLDGSLYVSAPPSIWKLTDTDDDGVADRREEWFRGKTLTGCANDLHGPYAGPDGRIYWCKGAFAEQTYERPKGPPLVTRAAHVFRCRPDGSEIEPVMTGGMDNPVEVAFSAGGERFFGATFVQHPAGGRRDGVIHAIYGGVYGKVHDVIDSHPRTGPDVMPVLAHLGPAAPSGLCRAESDALGSRDALFASSFNLRKIFRIALTPAGATFGPKIEDFLVCDDLDFHPTDVLEDADGSLLVVDTGGWYKLCCPTSQVVKPDLLGAIYRVKKVGATPVEDPRGGKLAWKSMSLPGRVALLDDPRPAVRKRAIGALGSTRGAESALAEVVEKSPSVEARRNAVWAATRIESAEARAVVRRGLSDPDETVRQASAHSSGLRRDRDALAGLLALLRNPSGQNRRAAAEAIGRIGESSAVPGLLDAASAAGEDPVLMHSITYALIEIADPAATAAGLDRRDPPSRRAALVAVDQMGRGGIEAGVVAPLLSSADPSLREAAEWVAGRHPEWGDALAGTLRGRLEGREPSEKERDALGGQLARLAKSESIRRLLADRIADVGAADWARKLAIGAMERSGIESMPASWDRALAGVLSGTNDGLISRAIDAAKAIPAADEGASATAPALARVAANPKSSAEIRLRALGAIPGGIPRVDAPMFKFLIDQMNPDRPVAARLLAADVASRSGLDADQLVALAEVVASAGPMEAGRLLGAFEKSDDPAVGLRLVAALEASPGLAGLKLEEVRRCLSRYPGVVSQRAERLYAAIDAASADAKARLEELSPLVEGGDVRRGQLVFNGSKANCVACHAIGYVGGTLGPDLTKVGGTRSGRDLLEAIVMPSASFVRSYEPMMVATKDGRIVSGILRKDSADEVILAVAADKEERIARAEIDEMKPGTASVMPSGLDKQLSPKELADLIAFLKACR